MLVLGCNRCNNAYTFGLFAIEKAHVYTRLRKTHIRLVCGCKWLNDSRRFAHEPCVTKKYELFFVPTGVQILARQKMNLDLR